MKEFSQILKELRNEKGITQETLGNVIHVSRSAIAKYENGLGLPSEEVIEALCNYFEVSRDDLFPKDNVEKIITEKNIKINNQRRLIIITSTLSLIIISLFVIIACFKYPKENHTILDSEMMNINIDTPNDYQKDILLFTYEGGYVYQRIEIHQFKFTKTTNLYLLRVSNTYVNGHVASFNNEEGFDENQFTKEVYMGINLLPSQNKRSITSWHQKHNSTFTFHSHLNPNEEIIMDEKINLFDNAYIEKVSNGVRFVYDSPISNYLLDYEYNNILRRCMIVNDYYNSTWKYEMLDETSKLTTFTISSSYLFEGIPNKTVNFEIDTKMINTNMSIEKKKIFKLSL